MSALSGQASPRYQALLQLLRTSETLWNVSRLFFARWDLGPSQFNVLNVLRDAKDGMTQIELSRLLIMHRSNVTGLVDRLESRGLVRRQAIRHDRRSWLVVLTPPGRELIETILPHYYAAAEQVWGAISPAHARQLASDLKHVAEQAEQLSFPQDPIP